MPDVRVSMGEFRSLEEKRKLAALSEAEERRWAELGRALGILEGGAHIGEPAQPTPGHAEQPRLTEIADVGTPHPPSSDEDGVLEAGPEEVMEVDPSDVFLLEPPAEASELAAPAPAGPAASAAIASPPVEAGETEGLETAGRRAAALESPSARIGSDPSAASASEMPAATAGSPADASIQAPPLESPVIDLLESDAMQGPAEPGPPQGAKPSSSPAPPLELRGKNSESAPAPFDVEPTAQWTQEAQPATGKTPTQFGPPAEPLPQASAGGSQPGTSSSRTGASGIASFESASFTVPFELTPSTPEKEPPPQSPQADAGDGAAEIARQGRESGLALAAQAQVEPAPAEAEAAPAMSPLDPPGPEGAPQAALVGVASGEGKAILDRPVVDGERRVVIHLVDGQVKRGTVRNLEPLGSSVRLQSSTGAEEEIPLERLKAIFFMLSAGSGKPVPAGQRIRVAFQDGREVVGFSSDFKTGQPGFFVIPIDGRANTERIFILRWSVQSIAEE